MNCLAGRYAGCLMIIVLVNGCLYNLKAQIPARNTDGTEVAILQKLDPLFVGCHIGNNIYDEAGFKRLTMLKECRFPNLNAFKPDFKSESLIGFSVRGDSCVRAGVSVFRNNKEKKYEIRIRNISGGCRAGGGWFQGWFTVKKIPSDYKIEINEIKVNGELPDDSGKEVLPNSLVIEKTRVSTEPLETLSYRMNNCIRIPYPQNYSVIKDEETFSKSIRADGSRERCVNNLEKIDFNKYTLLGIEINSGYCETPPLKYQAAKDMPKKKYILSISYPVGGICRALSLYDLWVLVPKLPEDHRVIFEVKAIKRLNKKND